MIERLPCTLPLQMAMTRLWHSCWQRSLTLAAQPQLIDQVDSIYGDTVLHSTAKIGYDNLVARILSLRPEMINAKNGSGENVLASAVGGGHEVVAERLLALKPDLIVETDNFKWSILHHAIPSCSRDFVARLWRLNPEALHAITEERNTPFSLAVLSHRDDLMELFQWKLNLDEIVDAFLVRQITNNNWRERYRPVLEEQCQCLEELLTRDVKGVVLEYLGFDPLPRPCKRSKR